MVSEVVKAYAYAADFVSDPKVIEMERAIRERGEEAFPILRRTFLETGSVEIEMEVVRQIGALQLEASKEARSELFRRSLYENLGVAEELSDSVKPAVLRALRYCGRKSDTEWIVPLVNDESRTVQAYALQTLDFIGDAGTAELLERALEVRLEGMTDEEVETDYILPRARALVERLRVREAPASNSTDAEIHATEGEPPSIDERDAASSAASSATASENETEPTADESDKGWDLRYTVVAIVLFLGTVGIVLLRRARQT